MANFFGATAHSSLGGIGNLLKHLPTGSVFLFEFLSPLATGSCTTGDKVLVSVLIFVCGLLCLISCFTDSYVDPVDGRRRYGFVTPSGLWIPAANAAVERPDMATYRLRPGDFVHAFLALLVFAALVLLDSGTVKCFYPGADSEDRRFLRIILALLGAFCSFVFAVFPDERNGYGYPPA